MEVKEINNVLGFWFDYRDHDEYREFIWYCGCRGTKRFGDDVVMHPCNKHIDNFAYKKNHDHLSFEDRFNLVNIFKSGGDKFTV